MSALVKGMENGMKEALIAIGGLEKVRVEQQEIPANQRHLADQAVGSTIQDVYAIQRSARSSKWSRQKCARAGLSARHARR
jgi:hypothetical protein